MFNFAVESVNGTQAKKWSCFWRKIMTVPNKDKLSRTLTVLRGALTYSYLLVGGVERNSFLLSQNPRAKSHVFVIRGRNLSLTTSVNNLRPGSSLPVMYVKIAPPALRKADFIAN